jgi:hypothetical protein
MRLTEPALERSATGQVAKESGPPGPQVDHVRCSGHRSRTPTIEQPGTRTAHDPNSAAAIRAGSAGPTQLRRDRSGHAFVTDGGIGSPMRDWAGSPIRRALARNLAAVPGVMEHGLFIGLAQTAILAGRDGVRLVERP